MSVETPTGDSTDSETTAEITFEEAVEEVYQDLPERYEQFSKTYYGNNAYYFLLIPETPYVDGDGNMQSRILTSQDLNALRDNNFSFHMTTQKSMGCGIAFWFEYEA